MQRIWVGEHSAWFKPYVAGWTAYNLLGVEMDRETAVEYMDVLIALHQGTVSKEEAWEKVEIALACQCRWE